MSAQFALTNQPRMTLILVSLHYVRRIQILAGVWLIVAYTGIYAPSYQSPKNGMQRLEYKLLKHLRMHQITLFQDKKSKNFLTLPPVGSGTETPPPQRLNPRTYGA